ncbi:MAG: ABC transporter permease [Sulfuricurvum sp.]|uniref:ABC transporter permease n=1 Tax=Sulfuricurvum sp. TaxID=2025608 RepID=UPI003D0D0E1E
MERYLNRWSIQTYLWILTLLLPAFVVIAYALGSEGETLRHLKETVLSRTILNTLYLIAGTSAVTLILGIGSAYLTTFYTFRFERIIAFLLAMPFVIPAYIVGYVYGDLFGFFGPVHLMLRSWGIKEYFDVLNFYSVVLILGLSLYPYVYLIVKASFSKSRSALLYPALNLGAGKRALFWRIILPLSRASVAGALTLVVMESISEYGTVKYYGVDTLSTAIFTAWFGLEDPQSAAYIASIAMGLVLSVLLLEKIARSGATYKSEKLLAALPKERLTGGFAAGAYLFMAFPITFGFLIPLGWIVTYSIDYLPSLLDEAYLAVMVNTFVVSGSSSALIVAGALLIGYTARTFPYGINRYLSKAASLGYALPGAVIAVGIVIIFTTFDKWAERYCGFDSTVMNGTIIVLVFGYVARFSAVAISTVDGSFERLGLSLNKASRSLGYTHGQTLRRIEIPLMRRSLIFAFALVFVDTIKELPLTLILRPFNYETLSTKTYEMAESQMVYEASIYALSIVLISLIPITLTILKSEH